jgi:high mobility group protein 1
MAEIMDKIKSAFKSITSSEEIEKEKESTSTAFSNTEVEKETKKNEKSEYEGFANGFPNWTLEPPQAPVRRKK